MGFKYMRLSGCKVIIESTEARLLRMQYMRIIRAKNTYDTNTVVYLDGMWLYAQYVLCRSNKRMNASLEWMCVLSENRSGFICAAHQAPVTNIDPKNLEKWLKNVFLQYLPSKKMIIVIDNVSTNSVTTQECITPYSKKMDMIIWLFKNRITFDSNMSKFNCMD